ncbi:MAG TPA: TMEM175 family protein [Candidatus Sulfotelmatobacter sp.]|nr:TMEM175 family protein [Candidatus Sulfotelmatobacter sp.]
MTTSRLEAFSDGVIAIIVTIMVLELRAPAQPTLPALLKVAPIFLSYGLSFLVVAIMWLNHHHLVHAVHSVTVRLLWSNLYLLFWMSLVPFVTDYMGKNHREPLAVALYGLDLSLCATGYYLLRKELIRQSRQDAAMVEYHQGIQRKNAFSGALYLLAAPLAYVSIYASFFIFALIPAMYFLPEKKLAAANERQS